MQVFKFSKKEQVNVFSIFMTISICLGILLFLDWNNLNLHVSTAFLVVSLISFVSLISSVKKANKTFKKIIVENDKVVFYFLNKMKDKLTLNVNQFRIDVKDDFMEVRDIKGDIIGKAYKNRINKEEWVSLISLLEKNYENKIEDK